MGLGLAIGINEHLQIVPQVIITLLLICTLYSLLSHSAVSSVVTVQ